ncbi:UDP-N-acetylmuramoyl-tripeptide--D-alanyl-D-alanine ligase [Pelagerythrobacter marensis]|uniref:UDP-N-acetylmuramoyl-tripeptide--D-alanyl-D-alanine ligase n=1 Tax=Pelagerythrobacter marensis TaxID=543877 RepID=A0A0G3X859_9SPHN|nr:UDP-N-acetylmuramoyl-tripeptide--D-alanyl-D-alanine ligase [Pelagerythrobacter marensis]AKM07740.1 UDP-N-acetylmuramoyl-tripeptide--D-alanyl-D-alanine ligase [Pelagerythrobacter marensis]
MSNGLAARLDRLRSCVDDVAPTLVDGERKTVLFFSFTDGSRRARTLTVTAPTAQEAWDIGSRQAIDSGADARWVRIDWVDAVERRTWAELKAALRTIKRNYFRLGISLDPQFEHAFLETELNANAMLYGGNKTPAAVLNEKNFAIYAARRHGLADLTFADDDPIWLFTTKGAFVGDDLALYPISDAGLDTGRRAIEPLGPPQVAHLIEAGSTYLASQVGEDGRFDYGWHPCFDRPIRAYNALRHASTVYAMLEAWEVTGESDLEQAIERALAFLTGELIETVAIPDMAEEAAFLVDVGDEIKLGGNAVAILALLKHHALTGCGRSLALAERLGSGILHMQDSRTGAFRHVLTHPSLEVKERFRIIYYDGEAAFGLMRLYEATGDERWLNAVEKAFDHFIAQQHWKAHDHWLSYAVNELTRYRPDDRYFRFGLDNFRTYIDFVLERITTFPTLLELMTAAEAMVSRLRSDPERRHLLDGVDLSRFYRALDHRAQYLLNGHFWPELAMFFANPAKIAGSFFIRHHAFRIRIDDVEHYLSGLVAYRKYLLGRAGEDTSEPSTVRGDGKRRWDAADMTRATGGRWHTAPPEGWTASGLCIFAPTFREGDVIALRPAEGWPGGIPPVPAGRLSGTAAAVIGDDAERLPGAPTPAMLVDDVGAAVLDMGRYAREQMRGKVIGVTGSAGKTSTVAMLAHALSTYGTVGQTRHNANLPHGIAWNLASIPWDAPHVVLELAIGRMAQNSRLTRPDIAIFTNVLPAHLEFHRDLATIARRKSAIFQGMRAGNVAILNRDMAEWERVHLAARSRGLQVINFGTSDDCQVRLIDYDSGSGRIVAEAWGEQKTFTLGAAGEHMAHNALAVVATLSALDRDPRPALSRLAGFSALEGRGREFSARINGARVTVLDEAYNANPGSMEAAIALLGSKSDAGRRIAVLGEMAELGPNSIDYHTALAQQIAREPIDRVYALGALYDGFWDLLPGARKAARPCSLEELQAALFADLADGDVVLFKGSHSTGLHQIISQIIDR